MKKLAYTLLGFLSIFVIALGYLAFNPQHLINKHSLQYFNDKYFSQLSVDWDKIDIQVENVSFFKKSINISGTHFCSKYEKHTICLKELYLAIDLNLSSLTAVRINQLKIEDQEILINLDPQIVEENKEEELSINEQLQSSYELIQMLGNYIPKDYSLILTNTTIQSRNDKTSLKASINPSQINLTILTKKETLEVNLQNKQNTLFGNINLRTPEIKSKIQSKIILSEKIEFHLKPDIHFLKLEKTLQDKISNHINLDISLSYSDENILLKLSEIQLDIKQYISSVDINHCEINHNYQDDSQIDFRCPQILIKASTKNNKTLKGSQFAQDFSLLVDIKALFPETIVLASSAQLGSLALEINSQNTKGWQFQASTDINIQRIQNSIKLNPQKLKWNLDVNKFSQIVKSLENSAAAIPSPLNSLEGTIVFSSDNPITLKDHKAIVPFQLDLNLDHAANNQIKVNSQGSLTYPLNEGIPLLELDAMIEKIYLYLPDIDPIRGIPPMKKDERVSKNFDQNHTNENTSEKSINYKIKLKTHKKDSIRIYYYLFKPYLPLNLDLDLSPDKMSYTLRVQENMNIEYLKRVLTLSNLKLSNNDSPPLDLKVVYETAGYEIYLNVVGTLDNPRLLLDSNPSESREDIISLLIYGRKSTDITSFEKENVGGTEAAIVDRALGIFSIWAFASTPIDSVSYDPSTRTYSAQISLPGGVNFSIGTDWDRVSILSFRKRINDTWSIVTSYLPASQDEDAKENILLQKEISF